MARITCAISGIRFEVSYLDSISVESNAGYFHPIFTLPEKKLYNLYYRYTKNDLSPTDSYLLFCAFLYTTGQVKFQNPASLSPTAASTRKFIANNLAQLIKMYQKTSVIKHPSFKQPSFVVSYDNSDLSQVRCWIEAWEQNLIEFNVKRADRITKRQLQEIENALEEKVTAGIPPEKLPALIADWAAMAAEFPADKEEQYKRVIRSCFNSAKMFNTSHKLIREIQEYCYANIEPGSIHFHVLCETLNEGIARHVDYLGGSSLALGYTVLPSTDKRTAELKTGELKTQAELIALTQDAPLEPPIRDDYPSDTAFLQARLQYRVAVTLAKTPDSKELDL